MTKEKIYILGDLLKKGNMMLRLEEAKQLRELGYEVFCPAEQAFNKKTEVTVEDNNKLAERIVKHDMEAIRKAEIIVADVDNDSVGSSVEIGAIMEFNWWWDNLNETIRVAELNEGCSCFYETMEGGTLDGVYAFLKEYPRKTVYCHTSDIRHTELPEVGMRRSFSINQFLHGACLDVDPKGIRTFEEILEELKDDI